MIDTASFVEHQLRFIEAERTLEASESQTAMMHFSRKELERRGLAMTNLEITGRKTGFGGKTLVELERSTAVATVKEEGDNTRFFGSVMRSGDIVRIEEQPSGSVRKKAILEAKQNGMEGVVSRVSDGVLTVTLSETEAEGPMLAGRVWVVKLADSVTYDRMAKQMTRLAKGETEGGLSNLTRILLGQAKPGLPDDGGKASTDAALSFFDTTLNESQREAVRHALSSPEIALIHGPPGTGKTYTLIEIIRQFVKQDKRVLVCGPSNISVDNIVERLVPTGVPIVRIGHPARLLPAVVNHSLDILTKTSSAGEIVKDIRHELDSNLTKMTKSKGKVKRELYLENKVLRKEFRIREKKSIRDILRGSAVVLATLHGSGSYTLQDEKFDIVIIDEASQALEASCWIPLLRARKVILAGDHMQLSPMIKSTLPRDALMNSHITLFERLLNLHGEGIKKLLTVQYRMNSLICQFPSDALYDGALVAGEGVGDRLLTDLPGVNETEDTREALVFIDTQGGEFQENIDSEPSTKSLNESKSNAREAELVVSHVSRLLEAGLPDSEIAIVTPYSAQVALLFALLRDLHPGIEIGTVDGFQGREKEVVIVSLVRSNDKGEVGFLSEKRRLNVAMTRPKRQLCVIGDSETVSQGGPFMKAWIEWLTENADLRYPEA